MEFFAPVVIVELPPIPVVGQGGGLFCESNRGSDRRIVSLTSQQPSTCEELAAFLEQNARTEKHPVMPIGGGTWLDFGHAMPPSVALHTNQLANVEDYPARDMTITVDAGLTVGQLQEILSEERQQIPVDCSQPNEATIGGAIATNVFGPRRFGRGTLRDYLIGLTAVDAGGRVFHAGGRVVKNVAGYDLCKLLVGSWGTLAVLTQVTLKVVPIPETRAWVWSTWDSPEALDNALVGLLTSETRPVALEVLNRNAIDQTRFVSNRDVPTASFALAVLVAGATADVDWQTQKLTQELATQKPGQTEVIRNSAAVNLLNALTEFPLASHSLSYRVHLLPSRVMEFVTLASDTGCSVQSHAGNGIVIVHAPEEVNSSEQAVQHLMPLRQWVESQGGSLVIQRCPAEWKSDLDVFGAGHSAWPLMKNLKQSLDPHNLLCPGRLFALDG